MQDRARREYAARRGWTVVMQVKEVGSGAAQREAREELLEAARRREIDSVLAWRMDPSARMTSPQSAASPTWVSGSKREAVLHMTAAASFLVFFQAYLVAPLIPSLRRVPRLHGFAGHAVPAYMLPYGISTLFYGPISDRFGRKAVILTLLGLMVVTMAGVATANTAVQMMVWRLLGGAITGGTVPIALAASRRYFSL